MIRFRFFDYFAIFLSLMTLFIFSWYAYAEAGGETALYIQNESDSWVYPLDKNLDIDVPGPLGLTHVLIRNGTVHVESSPCRDKICVYAGEISAAGDWVACLPNRVFLRIEGRREEAVDASVF